MKTLTRQQVVRRLEQAIEGAGSRLHFAAQNGVSLAYISDVITGKAEPGVKMLRILKLEKGTVYFESANGKGAK